MNLEFFLRSGLGDPRVFFRRHIIFRPTPLSFRHEALHIDEILEAVLERTTRQAGLQSISDPLKRHASGVASYGLPDIGQGVGRSAS